MLIIRTLLALVASFIGLVLLIPVLLLTLPVLTVSVLTRIAAGLFAPQHLTMDQLIQFDPNFGWKPIPNLNTHHLLVDFFHINTDADGWRGSARLDESDIIVFGDSFAAGYGIDEKELFANLSSRPRVKPVGIGGYSMVQELLWMERLAGRIQGKLVVWFVYYGNDLYDNLCPDLRSYRKPFLRKAATDEWEIVTSHIKRDRWPIVTRKRLEGHHHYPKLAELCSDSFLSDRAYSACEFLIRKGQEICARARAELVVVSIPDAMQLAPDGCQRLRSFGGDPATFDPNRPDNEFVAICQALDVTFVPGRTFLDPTCYKSDDCHWNAKGHRVVARELTRLHEQRKGVARTPLPIKAVNALARG